MILQGREVKAGTYSYNSPRGGKGREPIPVILQGEVKAGNLSLWLSKGR